MRRVIGIAALTACLVACGLLASASQAHQSGCHAAHSCPSDTGSYVCGDTGNYTYCPALSGSVFVSDYAPTVGAVLTAYASWTAFGTTTYQWMRSGVAITGAVAASYVVTAVDIGQTITLVSTAVDGRGQQASATSTPVTPTATVALSLSATRVKAGRSLTFRGAAQSVIDVAGLPLAVTVWKKSGRRWRLARSVSVLTDQAGTFSVTQKTSKRVTTGWRAEATFAGAAGVPAASSRTVSVTTHR